ncbi:putative membrane protein/domain protein [Bernardetia litoralis DSM 6794]|uniref:Putative membrane protein/domain protein n=1 Tax=Bernardetia litoralis (strain ATCC 23117 / DSM 6794 / NBRC 15988 / NCIMB 1366 / Fx l1 / Sio-4) TaxID=880071 RepID=I4AG36_BERLS|nr:RDD family protein [Bernardetia litoralis]AFM02921.1 putative membrane protein/domain protein [Bernardetia litoralis DSM 6794]
MKTISIRTSQNVTIEYELPSTFQRIIAWFIDLAILILANSVLALLFVWLVSILGLPDLVQTVFNFLVLVPLWFFYSLFCEIIFNGQSIGKRAMGIRVVKLNGDIPSLSDYFMRWAFRMVDIMFSFGSLATLLVTGTEKGQRLGDILAGTTVIKVKSTQHVNMKELLNIRSFKNYEPTYEQVTVFSEEEMLSIKTILNRASRFPKQKNTYQLLQKTATLAAKKLDISQEKFTGPQQTKQFLHTVLQDYIVLTR